tara:strand:+ start:3735 stop:3995 length:261 start_codon:yes stop_codon:yes gene_type:complete
MNTKDMISKLAEMALSQGLGREVHVTFSQLGKGRDYSVSVQKTLFEFEEFGNGPKGPMYLTLNVTLLQDLEKMLKCLNEIVDNAKE